jgi:sugar phosphate isomerase/epimerase
MHFGLNTYHITDRYGRYESGKLDPGALLYSVKEIFSQGFMHVELLLDVDMKPLQTLNDETISTLNQFATTHGISYSGHLPYKYVDISSLNEPIRKASVSVIKRAIEIADRIGVDKLVLHPAGSETKGFDNAWYPATVGVRKEIINDMVSQLQISLKEILSTQDSRRICLENLPYLDYTPFESVVSDFDLGVCLDVGHCILRKDDPVDFFKKYSDRVGVIHFHDVILYDTGNGSKLLDHEPLGSGIVDIKRFLDTLQSYSFNGSIVLEHLEEQKALKSIEYLKSRNYLTMADTIPSKKS